MRLLREEVAGAQEAAAFAAGNAKQYQALATSSDEALRSMQARTLACSHDPASCRPFLLLLLLSIAVFMFKIIPA